jgi:hypothetical protein
MERKKYVIPPKLNKKAMFLKIVWIHWPIIIGSLVLSAWTFANLHTPKFLIFFVISLVLFVCPDGESNSYMLIKKIFKYYLTQQIFSRKEDYDAYENKNK